LGSYRAVPAAFYAWQHVLAQVGGDTTVVYLLPLCQTNEANAEKPLSAKELGEMWKALSEEDKIPFNVKAAELKAAYDAIKPPSKTEQKKAAEAEVRTPGILRQKQWLP
jgi:hypothetical protein